MEPAVAARDKIAYGRADEAMMTTHITNSGVVYAKALNVEALEVEAPRVR